MLAGQQAHLIKWLINYFLQQSFQFTDSHEGTLDSGQVEHFQETHPHPPPSPSWRDQSLVLGTPTTGSDGRWPAHMSQYTNPEIKC